LSLDARQERETHVCSGLVPGAPCATSKGSRAEWRRWERRGEIEDHRKGAGRFVSLAKQSSRRRAREGRLLALFEISTSPGETPGRVPPPTTSLIGPQTACDHPKNGFGVRISISKIFLNDARGLRKAHFVEIPPPYRVWKLHLLQAIHREW